jgi:hypothetical protein
MATSQLDHKATSLKASNHREITACRAETRRLAILSEELSQDFSRSAITAPRSRSTACQMISVSQTCSHVFAVLNAGDQESRARIGRRDHRNDFFDRGRACPMRSSDWVRERASPRNTCRRKNDAQHRSGLFFHQTQSCQHCREEHRKQHDCDRCFAQVVDLPDVARSVGHRT